MSKLAEPEPSDMKLFLRSAANFPDSSNILSRSQRNWQ